MKEITLTKGKKAIVDDEDYTNYQFIRFHASNVKGLIYARNKKLGYLHTLIIGKRISEHYQAYFKNGNTLDCRKSNLTFIRKKKYGLNTDKK